MKKVNMLKKILSFSLALALFLTSPASVFAVDAEVPTVEDAAENNEGGAQETPVVTSEGENLKSDTLPAGEEQASESQSGSEDISSEDELNNGRAGSTDLGLEKTEGENEETENEDELTEAEAEEADTCEHADFRYESNGDGTHKKICNDCDEVVAEAEPCEFDENGKCVLCGYEDPEHKFTLTDENGIVKVTGTKKVLNGATKVVATEITIEDDANEFEKMTDALDEEVAKENKSVVDFVAYDITLYDNNDKEVKIQGDVNVVFTQLEVEGLVEDAYETEVYHYENESVDEMKQVETVSADTVQMVTNHFSTYIVAVKGERDKVLESEYVSVNSYYYWNRGYHNQSWDGPVSSLPKVNRVSRYYYYDYYADNSYYYYPLKLNVYVDDNLVETKGFAYYKDDRDTQWFRIRVQDSDRYELIEVKKGYGTQIESVLPDDDGDYECDLTNYCNKNNYNSNNPSYNYLNIYLKSTSSIEINDADLLKDGKLKAELSAELQNQYQGKDIQYEWSKKVGSNDWSVSEKQEISGINEFTCDEDWINIVLDQGTLTDEVDAVQYKVKAYYLNDNDEKVYIAESVSYDVKEYNYLRNGSFEDPKDMRGNDSTGDDKNDYWWAPQKSNEWYKENGGVWQTTGLGSINKKNGKDIEILNVSRVGYNKYGNYDSSKVPDDLNSFKWSNRDGLVGAVAADGKQFAEINCEAEGALYQDVLTIKGQELNYTFSHRARGVDIEKVEYDTMYVVIMPRTLAETLDTQAKLDSYLKNNGFNLSSLEKDKAYYNPTTGVYVRRATSPDDVWTDYIGTYTPTAYATRFYFLAGETAATKAGESNGVTIGNFLDKVWFSQKMPPAAEQKFDLQVKKTIKGLDEETFDQLKNSLKFRIVAIDANGNELTGTYPLKGTEFTAAQMVTTPDSGDDIVLTKTFTGVEIGISNNYNYVVREQNEALEGYDVDKTLNIVPSQGCTVDNIGNEKAANLRSKASARFEFVNTYTKSTAKLTIIKYAIDGKTQLDPSNYTIDGKIQSDPSNVAKYQFEIKKVNGDDLESVSVDGVTNDTFTLDGRGKIELNVPTGKYKITEKKVVYDDNSTVPKKDRLTLKNFSTRVVENEESEHPNKSGVMSRNTGDREYIVEVNGDTTVKFENLLYKETRTEKEPTINKRAVLNEKGTYDLTLEFTAPGVQVSSYQTVVNDVQQSGGKYDVVVVLDTSSSLSSNDLRNAKNAINNMVNSTSGKNVDILWKLVTFNTKAQILNNNAWSNNANNQFTNLVSNVNSTGNGTNYEDAFEKVIDALPSNRDNDNVKPRKVVIFVTDGAPNQDNHGHSAGSVDPTYYGYDSAKTKALSVKCDYFYALGVGLTDTKYNLANNVSLSSKEILNDIIANIDASIENKQVLNVTQYSEVSGALTEFTQGFLTNYSVADEVNTTTYATEAVITDVLTDYVDFAETNNRYTVKVMNGKTPVTNITSDVKDEGKTVTAIFTAPTNTDLSNYTYSVTFKIKATDDAYDYLLENESYPVDENNNVTKGEAETGTHAGQEGFFSNVSADVVFTLLDEKTTPLIYNKPVIQIAKIFGWEISKISSTTKNALGGAEFLLQNNSNTYYGQSDANGKVIWYTDASFATPASIVPGAYTLTETKAPEGYAKTEQTWEVTVSKSEKLAVSSGGQTVATVEINSNLANGVPMSVAKLTIENNVAYTLPETGGRGVYVYTIGGVLLMLGACLLLYKNKKNKNK